VGLGEQCFVEACARERLFRKCAPAASIEGWEGCVLEYCARVHHSSSKPAAFARRTNNILSSIAKRLPRPQPFTANFLSAIVALRPSDYTSPRVACARNRMDRPWRRQEFM